jgi:L-ribulokinase
LRDAAGIFKTVEEAQKAMCPKHKSYLPDPKAAALYEELYRLYRQVYFAFGDASAKPVSLANIMKTLREVAAKARQN